MYVTCSNLGTVGWFGNQLFRYFTLLHLSSKHKQPIQTSEWLGEQIFNLSCKRPDKKLSYQAVNEKSDKHAKDLYKPNHSKVLNSVDFKNNNYDVMTVSNAFYHTSHMREHKNMILKNLRFNDQINKNLIPAIQNFIDLKDDEKLVIVHARVSAAGVLGGYSLKWPFPKDWYKSKLEEISNLPGKKKYFVCTDNKEVFLQMFPEFEFLFLDEQVKYDLKPISTAPRPALDGEVGGTGCFGFVPDFVIMTLADHLLISDSTFSYAAAMLNRKKDAKFYKPSIKNSCLIEYDPWSSYILDFRTHTFEEPK